MYGDHRYTNIHASESLSMALNTANTAPIPILSCAADSKWWSRDVLNENFSAEEWSWDMRSVDSSRSLSNRWHVNLAPGSASWFSTPNDRIVNNYITSRGRSGGLMVSTLIPDRAVKVRTLAGGHCAVFLGKTLSQFLSHPWIYAGGYAVMA